MNKLVLYIGLLDKDSKVQIISTEEAKMIVADCVGDCTISEAQGRYTHTNGEKVTEPTLIVEMLFKDKAELKSDVAYLKKALNQESIAFQEIALAECDLW